MRWRRFLGSEERGGNRGYGGLEESCVRGVREIYVDHQMDFFDEIMLHVSIN